MQRSGFGARNSKSISSTSSGRQTAVQRAGGPNSLIRAIAGSDLAVWLDADDITVADAANVTTWPAKEGDSPSQNSVTPRPPTFDVDGVNGRPAVLFDGSNECLQFVVGGLTSNQMANTIASTNSCTAATAVILELGATYHDGTDGIVLGYSTGNSWAGLGNGTDSYETSTVTCAGAGIGNNVLVAAYDRSPTTDTIKNYISGAPVTPNLEKFVNSTDPTDWEGQVTNIGSRNNGASLPLAGNIRELIVINRALDAGEAFRLSKALMFKSGVTKLLSGYA
jgi:hypothetical protein